MRIAMIGTRGVPPQYGGFETAVDEIGRRLVDRGHEVLVYCRNPGQQLRSHHGMSLVNLPAIRHLGQGGTYRSVHPGRFDFALTAQDGGGQGQGQAHGLGL